MVPACTLPPSVSLVSTRADSLARGGDGLSLWPSTVPFLRRDGARSASRMRRARPPMLLVCSCLFPVGLSVRPLMYDLSYGDLVRSVVYGWV